MRLLRTALLALLRITPLRRLLVELDAHLPVLPVLSGQLREASQEMEREIGGVCSRFQDIASRSQESVQRASTLLREKGSGGASLASVIEDCRGILSQLLERIEHSSSQSLAAAAELERIDGAVRKVSGTLAEIDRIAFTNKLLALNAKIEAVHAGELGAGFGLVADQISQQADRSTELSQQIADVLKNLTGTMRQAAAGLGELASADRAQAETSRREVVGTFNLLERAGAEMRDSLQDSSRVSHQLGEDIARLIVGLQFQDRVNQRIGHVIESLDSMHAACAGLAAATSGSPTLRRREVADSVHDAYTMHAERQLHSQLAGTAAQQQDPSGSNVELF